MSIRYESLLNGLIAESDEIIANKALHLTAQSLRSFAASELRS